MATNRPQLAVRTRPPLLTTESPAEFAALRARFTDAIKPRDAIERMYCDDVVFLVWDAIRLRRTKAAMLNLALRDALYDVLVTNLGELEGGQETVAILDGWFVDAKVTEKISAILGKYKLDESAIEAEAFRRCATELALIEQMLASAETRRNRALCAIGLYRESLAQRLRDESIQVDDGVARLEVKTASGGRR